MKYVYKDITILTVTHNSENVIDCFLNNINKKFKLIVVDNNSRDSTKLILKKDNRPYKTLFFNKIGLGFAFLLFTMTKVESNFFNGSRS